MPRQARVFTRALMQKGLRLGNIARLAILQGFHSRPDAEGITTRMTAKFDIGGHVFTRALMQKGLRHVHGCGPLSFSFHSRPDAEGIATYAALNGSSPA